MPKFTLHTLIDAPVERVFDLSRSIDLHVISTQKSNEKAVAGVTTGLINEQESVTWNAYHLFRKRSFTSKITGFKRPVSFKDEMQHGDFKKFSHEHLFSEEYGKTMMIDRVDFESPFGFAGKLFNTIYLEKYIRNLLSERNKIIKEYAESDNWKHILKDDHGK